MAARYGLPAAEIFARLCQGRFRVKASVDQATADDYARDLESLGARVAIEEARPATPGETVLYRRPVSSVRTSPALVRRDAFDSSPATRAASPALEPAQAARPSKSSLPPRAAARTASSSLLAPPIPRPSAPVLLPHPAQRLSSPALPAQMAQRPRRPSLSSLDPSRSASVALDTELDAASRPTSLWVPAQRPTEEATDMPPRHTGELTAGLASLGALDGTGALSLDLLDRNAELEPDPPTAALDSLPASIGPAAQTARSPRPSNAPLDLFEPPAEAADAFALELVLDDLDRRAPSGLSESRPTRPSLHAPGPDALARRAGPSLDIPFEPQPGPSVPPLVAATPEPRSRRPSLDAPGAMSLSPRLAPLPHMQPGALPWTDRAARRRRFTSPRLRFGAGVFLAIILGFLPADLVAALQERDAFQTIDERVIAAQAAVDSVQSYDALDSFREEQLAAKHDARRTIVLTSMLLWGAIAGGLAYLWFKRVPWDRRG